VCCPVGCPWKLQGQFWAFSGMLGTLVLRTRSATTQYHAWSWRAFAHRVSTVGGLLSREAPIWDTVNRVTQGCHLGRVARLAATVALAVWEILPITSVRAPRYFVRRSYEEWRGAKMRKVAGQIGGLERKPSRRGNSSWRQRSGLMGSAVVTSRAASDACDRSCRCGGRPPQPCKGGNRERLAWGAGGGHERPCSPARGGRNPRPGWPWRAGQIIVACPRLPWGRPPFSDGDRWIRWPATAPLRSLAGPAGHGD
jgi:hypothetical protein